MRKADIAKLAGVPVDQVEQVEVSEVRRALADQVPANVLDVATQEPKTWYWRTGTTYYLDDPYFGPVVAFTDLAYNSEIGLHIRKKT